MLLLGSGEALGKARVRAGSFALPEPVIPAAELGFVLGSAVTAPGSSALVVLVPAERGRGCAVGDASASWLGGRPCGKPFFCPCFVSRALAEPAEGFWLEVS